MHVQIGAIQDLFPETYRVKIESNHGLTNDLVFLSSSSGWAGGHAPCE